MSYRISDEMLNSQLKKINSLTCGDYLLHFSDGVALCKGSRENGKVNVSGYGTKKQAYNFMQAFIKGIVAANDLNKAL